MRYLLQILFLELISLPLIVLADDDSVTIFDTVVVIGEKGRPDYPINAPLELSEFEREVINQRGFTRVQDVADYVPNLNLMDAGANGFADRTSIRGLANTPIYTTPSVILYIDDVPYLSSFSYTNQLIAPESIEVYRGPQGGLFGRNSYGGVMNVKSRRPKNKFQGNLTVDNGNFDYISVDSYLSGALIDNQLYFTLGGFYTKREGYLSNTFLDSHPDSVDHLSGRMSLLWTPTEQWEISLMANLEDFDDGVPRLVSLLSDNIFETQSNLPGALRQSSDSEALRLSYHDEAYEFLSVTARRYGDFINPTDLDFQPLPIFSQKNKLQQQQWSQEFRLRSIDDKSDWLWSAGLFFSNNHIDGGQVNTIMQQPQVLQINALDETSYAIFSRLSYQGLDSLRFYFDLRLDYVEKHLDSSLRQFSGQTTSINNRTDDIFASPKLTIDYSISAHILGYISTGLAFKPGGFSAQSATLPQYNKETLWASELGVKTNWLDKRFTANMTLFYYDIDDYQLEEGFSPVDYAVVNAPKTVSYGLELELQAKFLQTVQLEGGLGYTHIEFEEYSNPFTGINYDGNKVPYVPEFNFNLAAQYKHPHGYFARAELNWTGETYYDAGNSDFFTEDNYVVFNATIGYEHQYFNIYAYANNFTDTEYFSYKLSYINLGTPGEPRTYGIKVGLTF